MEGVVDFEVAHEIIEVHGQELVDLAAAQLQPGQLVTALQALGGEAGCGAFENAAGVDRVPDVGNGELADAKSARRQGLENTFACQPVEGEPDRGP